MATPSRVRVPIAHRQTLADLASLPQEGWSRLYEAFVSVDSLQEDALTNRLSELPEISDNADALVQALLSMSLSVATHRRRPSNMAETVAMSGDLEIGSASRSLLAERLEMLLSTRSLVLLTKAVDVVMSHERMLHTVRIFTDMRPIFGEETSDPPISATIMHVLRLDYFDDTSRDRSTYITLTDQDLARLREEVERAESKSASLAKMLKATGLTLYARPEKE
jgi:hypothetical protein